MLEEIFDLLIVHQRGEGVTQNEPLFFLVLGHFGAGLGNVRLKCRSVVEDLPAFGANSSPNVLAAPVHVEGRDIAICDLEAMRRPFEVPPGWMSTPQRNRWKPNKNYSLYRRDLAVQGMARPISMMSALVTIDSNVSNQASEENQQAITH